MCAVLTFCDPLSYKLLIGDDLISSEIWCEKALVFISKTTNCTRCTGMENFGVFKKSTHAY